MRPATDRFLKHYQIITVLMFAAGSAATCFADKPDPCVWLEGDDLAAVCANLSEKEKEKFIWATFRARQASSRSRGHWIPADCEVTC